MNVNSSRSYVYTVHVLTQEQAIAVNVPWVISLDEKERCAKVIKAFVLSERQSQSKLLGRCCVFSSLQCWCTRFAD